MTRKRQVRHGPRHPAPDWEPVWEGDGEADATIIAESLRADGIRARAVARTMRATFGTAMTMSSWVVAVPTTEADEARKVLRKRGEGTRLVSGSDADIMGNLRTIARLSVGTVLVVVAVWLLAAVVSEL